MVEILYVALSLTFLVEIDGKQHLRVVQGRDAKPGEYPYVLSLQYEILVKTKNGSFPFRLRLCTGSLITKTWVLTASHCVTDPQQLWVRYGNHTLPWDKALNFFRRVIKRVKHPAYIDNAIGKDQSDIALLQTEEVPVQSVGRLSAAEFTSFIGLTVKYAGYGITSRIQTPEDELKPLQVGEGGAVPCNKKFSRSIDTICVVPRCDKLDSYVYEGDSGGPLFYNDHIIGVNSAIYADDLTPRAWFSEHCPVSPYLDWIYNIIQQGN